MRIWSIRGGDSFAPGGAHWVSDNGTGLSTCYDGHGVPQSLVVSIPPPAGQEGPSAPTGSVFNNTGGFAINGHPSYFLFSTEDGTLAGWGGGTTAATAVDNSASGAVYKGLALLGNRLYVPNFHAGTIEVYDSHFAKVSLPAGAFSDTNARKHYAPFNIQPIGNLLYVAYAEQDATAHDNINGTGLGYVEVFDGSGVLKQRLQRGYWFNAPWGIALAPSTFGPYKGNILVGNFGSGWIAAFSKATGKFAGLLRGPSASDAPGAPLSFPGLWGLYFGNNGAAGSAKDLYYTQGADDEADGVFGVIRPLP